MLLGLAIFESFAIVIRVFSEKARTRGFPPPSFDEFGFVVVTL